MSGRQRFIQYYLPPILWGCLIFGLSTIPGKSMPRIDIVDWDKGAHIGVNFIFAFLVHRAFSNKRRTPKQERSLMLFVVLVVSVFGATDEYHQLFVPGRECDFFDWLSDTLGGVLFAFVYWRYEKWKAGRLAIVGEQNPRE